VEVISLPHPSDLVALAMHNEEHSDGCEGGGEYQNQNAAAQSLNHSLAGRGGLGVAQGTALTESWRSKHKQ